MSGVATERKKSAWAIALATTAASEEPDGRPMWYAPKRMPSTVEPERLSGKVRSVNVVDSVALANTNEFPVPATATQSICRCQFDTSIPERPVCARASCPVASTAAETTSSQKSAATRRFLWLATASGMTDAHATERVFGRC